MRTILLLEASFAVICQVLVMLVLRKIYHTHGMKSVSWIVIGTAFVVLLIKWMYGAFVIHTMDEAVQFPAVIYELLTDIFAVLLLIGYYLQKQELQAGERFSKALQKSIVINKNILED